MNNPYGTSPEYALYPLPERATGWRVWRLLADLDPGVRMTDYRDAFDRRNLLTGPWSDRRAKEAVGPLRRELQGRQVVLLGAKLRDMFGLERRACGSAALEHLDRENYEPLFTYVHWLPHPSGGLNPWYNLPENRAVAGGLLLRLFRHEHGLLDVHGAL